MRSRLAHAALLVCALFCSGATAQQPADVTAKAEQSLAALAAAPAAGADAGAVAKARAASAATFLDCLESGALAGDVLRRLDVGAAKVLLGEDAGARDALIAAVTGRRDVTVRWWAPLSTLARHPERPEAVSPPAVRCLASAAWPKLVEELVAGFEDAAAPVEARVRDIRCAGALARFDLPKWGPVGPLVKALNDGLEPVRLAAERELESLLLLPEATAAADLRRWWESAKSRRPSAMWRERARDEFRAKQARTGKAQQELLALLPHLDMAGLVKTLAYDGEAVRLRAAELLAGRPDPQRDALTPLTDRLSQEPSAAVREAILVAIGARLQPGDTAVVQVLMTMASEKTERHPSVRRAAIRALARTPGPAAAQPIGDALRADTSPVVREAAAEALTGFAGHVDVATVAKALSPGTEKTAAVRVAVARTLGKLGEAPGGAGACAPLADAAKSDPDENVRWQAVFALGNVICEGTEAVDAMEHALRAGEAARVRKLAAGQLGKRKEAKDFDRIAGILAKVLGDADKDVAVAAADSLGRLGAGDAYRLWGFAKEAEKAGQQGGAALLGDLALRVMRNGGTTTPLTEADELKVRMWLVDLWQRVGEPGKALPHAQWLYTQQPTVGWARTIAELATQAGKLKLAMTTVREAAVRFPKEAAALTEFGLDLLFKRVAGTQETIEIAAEAALEELGEIPDDSAYMSRYLRAGATAARELQAAQSDAAVRTQLHERLAGPTGWDLAGLVDACKRRVAAEHALGAEADAALRAAGRKRFPPPALGPPQPDWTAEQRRKLATAWENQWRQVKAALTEEPPAKDKEKKPK